MTRSPEIDQDETVGAAHVDLLDFYKGFSLTERLQVLDETMPTNSSHGAPPGDAARAARRLQRWRAATPLRDDDVYQRRLQQDGVTETQLLRMLGEAPTHLANRHGAPTEWHRRIVQLYGETASPAGVHVPTLKGQAAQLLVLVAPIIRDAKDRFLTLLNGVRDRFPDAPFEPVDVLGMCTPALELELLALLRRTLVLELNVAREEGWLSGSTAEERFQSFLDRIGRRDSAMAVLTEYAVLSRRLLMAADNWCESCLEVFRRLAEDREVLYQRLGQDLPPDTVVSCRLGLGDAHFGGRTVAMLVFKSGLRVIYKPRPLAIDAHFQNLLQWLNARGTHPHFKTTTIIDRCSYGWAEFIERRPCHDREALERFYQRLGGYLALLYTLVMTDVHFENIIASGEHPFIIDLETLFHPHFDVEIPEHAEERAAHALTMSVMRMGLLPRRGWANQESEGIDFTGLGSTTDQLTPRAAQTWEGVGTDAMRVTRRRVKMGSRSNRPTLNGKDVQVFDFAKSVEAGFESMYRLLLAHRAELLADDGPIRCFAEAPTRALLRPTHLYNLMSREATHPDNLRDGLDLDRFLDRLWGTVERYSYTEPLIPYERSDLWRGDIPHFSARPGSRDVWTSSKQKLVNYFPRSGLDLSLDRIASLCEEDLARQLWFIRASFTSLSVEAGGGKMPSYELDTSAAVPARSALLEKAGAIGDRLSELAIRGQGDASWLGLAPLKERYWSLVPLSLDLYSGLSGVLLFLGYLSAIDGRSRHRELAQEVRATVLRHLRRDDFKPRNIGAFGDLGVIHTLVHLGEMNDPALLDEAEALLFKLPDYIAEDTDFDILSGAAGCILLMLELDKSRPSSKALEMAVLCAEHLLKTTARTESGLGWTTPLGPRPLTGLLHGTAGIAWALLRLSAKLKSTRYEDVALQALADERSAFSDEHKNWKDLREEPAKDGFMVACCHGAPGVGLARLFALPHHDTPEVRAEIRAAVETTRVAGFGTNHSICHGDFGNLELLTLAMERFGDAELRGERDRLVASIFASLDVEGILCGVPQGVEAPGLMVGLAGVGYSLLRLAEPSRIPPLLAFEQPHTAAADRTQGA